jgi:23S rRNA pseudouridine1911/1915/1917 synthase
LRLCLYWAHIAVMIITHTIPPELAASRLDKALAVLIPEMSRTRIQALAADGCVSVNGASETTVSRKMILGDIVALDEPPAAPPEPLGENIPLTILHEDADLIVLYKPAGLVVHPSGGHETGTLVNALIAHCGASLSGIGGIMRPGIVHRLDKDTSGVMVVAKNDRAHRALSEQFADHGRTGPLERAYVAFVWGVPARKQGTIHTYIDRSTANREKMAVTKEGVGREAITHYEVEAVFNGADGTPLVSKVVCMLETGRTHQIRVHMAHLGHALLGDPNYGGGFRTKTSKLTPGAQAALVALGRQALHAAVLGFAHPTNEEEIRFESDLPKDMAVLLAALQGT